jgi:UDP-glucose 4-epimerase
MGRYLVTGVAGFIGSWIAQRLVSQGHEVRGLDSLATGSRANLSAFANQIEFRHGDIRKSEDLLAACEGIDGVFHQAAIASVQEAIERPIQTNQINHVGTLHLLEAAKARGVKRIVFASSSAIYGNQSVPLLHERLTPAPLSAYGAQKLACEHSLRVAHALDGIETVALRYFNVFGPRQSAGSPYSGVIARFIRYVVSGSEVPEPAIYGDGEQSRDFVFIEDVVTANMLAMMAPADAVAGKAFNVGTGHSQSINNLVQQLRVVSGEPLRFKHLPARPGEIRCATADISCAVSLLGYVPQWTFREGLVRTLSWYRGDGPRGEGKRKTASFQVPVAPQPIDGARPAQPLSSALRQAYRQGEFRLAYQPILDLRTHRVVGAEALVRWQRGQELVTAAGFIEELEKSDFFEAVEEWALQEACSKAAWIHQALTPHFRIAVNVAPQQWVRGRLREAVNNALLGSRCDPTKLDLEITERTALCNCPRVQSTMRYFRDLGITVTLDDFGAGYSNFSCLRQFPISHLKIDKYYCQHTGAQGKALEAILAEAARSALTCTAEGVETDSQLLRIMQSGCDEAQGFLIARPMDFNSLVTYLGNDLVVTARRRQQAS